MITKKLAVFTALILMTISLWAQDRKWEVGWQLFNTNPVPTGIDFESSSGPAFLNGLLIKHRMEGYKQRLSVQYLKIDFKSEPIFCCDQIAIENNYEGVELTFGIEKSMIRGIMEYYFVLDMGLGAGQYRGSQSGGFIGGRFETFNLRYRSVGAYPGAGVNIWVNKRIAINGEFRWPGVFYNTRGGTQLGFADLRSPAQGVAWQKRPESTISIILAL